MHTRTLAILAVLALSGAAQGGPAVSPAPRFTLLTRNQPPLAISLLSISADNPGAPATITYLDPGAKQQTIAFSDLVALAPAAWVPTPESVAPATDGFTSDLSIHRLDLTDGERFVGEFAPPPSRGASAAASTSPPAAADSPVAFKHDRIGLVTFPLDRVQRYAFDARHPPDLSASPLSGVADTLVLANGDRLEGLVTQLGQVVVIETKPAPGAKGVLGAPARGATTTIDSRQVLLANLVNPGAPLKALRVDLADGSVLAADRLAADTQSGRLAVRALAAGLNGPTVSMDIGHLAAVVPDASRLIPLCTVPFAAQAAAAGRISTAPAQVLPDVNAPLSAADIVLPGPMTVEWTIPRGASTIIGYAQMDDRSFAWGDCTVVVSVVGPGAGAADRELAKGRLNGQSPSLIITSPLGSLRAGDRLRVRVDAGERGPIQDRVVLRRMMLLTAPAAN